MKIKVQTCWNGNNRFYFRALIGGGILINVDEDPVWNRKIASLMLDEIERSCGVDRKTVRFVHV
jgi:hypothetical protein